MTHNNIALTDKTWEKHCHVVSGKTFVPRNGKSVEEGDDTARIRCRHRKLRVQYLWLWTKVSYFNTVFLSSHNTMYHWWRCPSIQSSFHATLELCDLKWSWQKAGSPDKSLGIFQSQLWECIPIYSRWCSWQQNNQMTFFEIRNTYVSDLLFLVGISLIEMHKRN